MINKLSWKKGFSLQKFISITVRNSQAKNLVISSNINRFLCSCVRQITGYDDVKIEYKNGFPIMRVPLPSRKNFCCFVLKPVSENIADLCTNVINEDKGIDFVAVYDLNGERIARSTSIEHLLFLGDFKIRINDEIHLVQVPALLEGIKSRNNDRHHTVSSHFGPNFAKLSMKAWPSCRIIDGVELSTEKLRSLNDIRSIVASLYTTLNIREFTAETERNLLKKLEDISGEMEAMEKIKFEIDSECELYSEKILWRTLALICIQTGFFARLTWWEYSWDIMEPITYFAMNATVIISFVYYLYTNQPFDYSSMRNRYYTVRFHKLALKKKFNIARYNELCQLSLKIRRDLDRIRDPLHQHLSAKELSSKPISGDRSNY